MSSAPTDQRPIAWFTPTTAPPITSVRALVVSSVMRPSASGMVRWCSSAAMPANPPSTPA